MLYYITYADFAKALTCTFFILPPGFMYELTEYEETITEFDEQLWMMVIDKAIVHQDGRLVFVFRNGCEIEG